MADRVHPAIDDLEPTLQTSSLLPSSSSRNPTGTFVIRIPKDLIYKIPPPENEYHYRNHTCKLSNHNRRRRPHPCRCFLYYVITLTVILLVLSTTFYVVFRPETPKYSIDSISLKNFNLSSSDPISPRFDIAIRARNPNKKIGIYYQNENSGAVYYDGEKLGSGLLPVFYQPPNNVTVFDTVLEGATIVLGSNLHHSLTSQLNNEVPFELRFKAPIKFKAGSVKSWTFTITVVCNVTVDKLTSDSKVVHNDCDFSVKPW